MVVHAIRDIFPAYIGLIHRIEQLEITQFYFLNIGSFFMNFYEKYKSPLGYQTSQNQIDTYRVDHRDFSTQDELRYQFARQNKKSQVTQDYNNQGITENYPQQGRNFWGNPDNNYWFGRSNIHGNIENNNPFENTGNTFGLIQTEQNDGFGSKNQNQNQSVWNKNQYQTATPSRYNLKELTDRWQQYQNNSFGDRNSALNSSLNNGSIFSPENMQSLNLNASSALSPQQNSFSTYSQPYQHTQNSLSNSVSDTNDFVKANIIFDDVYYSELGKDGNVIYQGTNNHEGGYSDRINDLGGPTNYGVRQTALNEYNNWNSPLRTGFNFPKNIENLTPNQAKQIMDEMYYQRYNINKLQNLKLARNTFDAEVNQGTDSGKMLSRAMNRFYGYQKGVSPKYFYENYVLNDTLARAVNNLTSEETIKVNDILVKLRMEKYFQSVDKNPFENVNNINGWYNRTKSYYSNPQEFEKLYKNRVDDYIKNKYPQFYII